MASQDGHNNSGRDTSTPASKTVEETSEPKILAKSKEGSFTKFLNETDMVDLIVGPEKAVF
ncbi:hypothetical protein DSL72_000969 [Monilinia vaccinii-corymbosi]|uniref:Uncharacterized protein n=1 Tax=Monilinia vaccinii-corymbosi TaxID=61207 RepID=A0A8A3P588_9HELO|nr:hypothetical protein DSL72_000969 [Monilinia vaccinii-corymbosi]